MCIPRNGGGGGGDEQDDDDDEDSLQSYLDAVPELVDLFADASNAEPDYEALFPPCVLQTQLLGLAVWQAARGKEPAQFEGTAAAVPGGGGGESGEGEARKERLLETVAGVSAGTSTTHGKAFQSSHGLLRMRWVDEATPCETLVIGFASLGVLDATGVPRITFEFVGACRSAGATHALFVKDEHQSWYLRGVDAGTKLGGTLLESAEEDSASAAAELGPWEASFDGLVARLRAEVERLRPARLVTLGASMGGYAAIRAGAALGAHAALAFVPQVFLDPREREHLDLPWMAFMGSLRRLHANRDAWGIGGRPLELASLLPSVAGCTTPFVVDVHVGARESGDVREALLLREAAAAAAGGATVTVHVHSRQGHLLFRDLKETGQLSELLQRLIRD